MAEVLPDLSHFLSAAPAFQRASEAAISAIAQRLNPISLAAGEVLMRQNSADDSLYIVLSGSLTVTATGRQGVSCLLATIGPGETAAGWSLFSVEDDSAGIFAAEDSLVGRLSRPDFDSIVQSHPSDVTQLLRELNRVARRSKLLFALHLSDLFGELNDLALIQLQDELELHTFSSGDAIFREGDPGDALYVIVSGRVRTIIHRSNGEEAAISELGIGDVVGDLDVLSGECRVSTVHAIRDTQAARLSGSGLTRFLVSHPEAAVETFMRKLVVRVRRQWSEPVRPAQSIRTIAVVAIGHGVATALFTQGLCRSLAKFGSATHLGSEQFDAVMGRPGLAQSPETSWENVRIVEWLSRQESHHDYVVYQCDSRPTGWTRRCLRQADHVLLVGRAGTEPPVEEIEESFSNPRQSLILLYDDGSAGPAKTRRWLETRQVDAHYHVRLHDTADFDRVARFLSGRAFGLTLGGGFARGFVNIGVFRALAEAGIIIDAIGGNSMGAVVAAQKAQGWDEERMIRENVAGCIASLKDSTLPWVSFKSGRKFSELVRRFNGDTLIEDLWLPYFCVSANLNRAHLHVHTSGSLTKAILASSRVPGVFPPVIYDGEMHVDGAVLNNVPVDVMRGVVRDGLVMGVDPIPARQFDVIPDYGFTVNGWHMLRDRLWPFGKGPDRIPNIAKIMLRTVEFGGVFVKNSRAAAADLYLRPPLQKFKPRDFAAAREIVEIGYRSAAEAIEKWLNSEEVPPLRKPEVEFGANRSNGRSRRYGQQTAT